MAIEYADDEEQAQQPKPNAGTGYKWNAQNAFDAWDLNPLAGQVGGGADGVRDALASGRDAFLSPYMQKYRDSARAGGWNAEEGDEGLFNDQAFRSYVSTGNMPAANPNAPPAQQWAQGGGVAGAGASGAGDSTGRRSDLFNLLMQRIQSPITPDVNDPTIRRQADAYSAQQTRASRDFLADAAERGGPYMNMTGESRLAAERAGQNSAGFEAELIGREQDTRRDSISKDLGLYGGLLGDSERSDLAAELGRGNLALNRDQLTESQASRQMSNDAFLRELALRQWGMQDDSAYRWAGLGG